MGMVSFFWKEHGDFLLKSIADMFNKKFLLDTNVACGKSCLRVHRLILAAFLPTFRNSLFVTDGTLQPLGDLTLDFMADHIEDVTALVRFMYTGMLTVSTDRVEHLRRLAEVLCLKGVVEALATEGHFDPGNGSYAAAAVVADPVVPATRANEWLMNLVTPAPVIKQEIESVTGGDGARHDDNDDDATSSQDHFNPGDESFPAVVTAAAAVVDPTVSATDANERFENLVTPAMVIKPEIESAMDNDGDGACDGRGNNDTCVDLGCALGGHLDVESLDPNASHLTQSGTFQTVTFHVDLETQAQRKARQNRERVQRWRAKQSEETLAKLRRQNALSNRRRRIQETLEQAQAQGVPKVLRMSQIRS